MNKYIEATKAYVNTHKELLIGIAVVVGFVAIIVIVMIIVVNNNQKAAYQYPPVNACSLLTETEAKELLGAQVIPSQNQTPVASGNTVTTKCSFTDMNPDQNSMKIAAVAVRSGVDDKGVQQNKVVFAAAKSSEDVEIVNDLGDSAFFNPRLGQLNVLNGYDWIILSYGVGATPEASTLEQVKLLAEKVISNSPALPTF